MRIPIRLRWRAWTTTFVYLLWEDGDTLVDVFESRSAAEQYVANMHEGLTATWSASPLTGVPPSYRFIVEEREVRG